MFTLGKQERLCSRKAIDQVFKEGKAVFSFPLRTIFCSVSDERDCPVQVVFNVPKKNFKQAVKRNLLRRRMKEAYRLNKHELYDHLGDAGRKLNISILYIDKKEQDFETIERAMIKTFRRLIKTI